MEGNTKGNTKKLAPNQQTQGPPPRPGPCKHIFKAFPMPKHVVCIRCGKHVEHSDIIINL